MEWRVLTEAEMEAVYLERMAVDFPPEELKPFEAIRQTMRAGLGENWGVFCPDEAGKPRLCAYLCMLRCGAHPMVLLDYFAVLPALRGKGLGEKLLHTLAETYALRGVRAVLIESELPRRAPDSKMAARRLGFYERAGAVKTAVGDRAYQGWFQVLSLCCGQSNAPTDAEVWAALGDCYRQFLPEKAFAQNFELFFV